MAKKAKVHWLIWYNEPNESDPEGDGYLACGRDGVDRLSEYLSSVTCKDCLSKKVRIISDFLK